MTVNSTATGPEGYLRLIYDSTDTTEESSP